MSIISLYDILEAEEIVIGREGIVIGRAQNSQFKNLLDGHVTSTVQQNITPANTDSPPPPTAAPSCAMVVSTLPYTYMAEGFSNIMAAQLA